MRSFRKTVTFTTDEPEQVINVTSECRRAVEESGIKEGMALIFPLHTSSCVFISDSDSSVALDYMDVLSKLIPQNAGYRHDETDHKRNAHGHLRSIITGHHVTCPVTYGALDFGAYHTVYYLELDGQRPKEVLIKIIGE